MAAAGPGLAPGQVWAQTSTVGIDWTERLSKQAADHDLVYLDAPVLGTRQPAEQGQLLVFAAGVRTTTGSMRASSRAPFRRDRP